MTRSSEAGSQETRSCRYNDTWLAGWELALLEVNVFSDANSRGRRETDPGREHRRKSSAMREISRGFSSFEIFLKYKLFEYKAVLYEATKQEGCMKDEFYVNFVKRYKKELKIAC